MSVRSKKITSILALSAIIAFHFINNLIWLRKDASFLKLDSWRDFRYSLEVFDFIKGLPDSLRLLSSLEPQSWHGIFVGFITAPFYILFGVNQDTGIMTASSIFLIILVLSTYGIAKKIFSTQAGLLSAFLVTFYPLIFNHMRLYMLDLPLTSIACASLYFLISSDCFKNKKNSFFFALFFSLGLLTKFNYLLFIFGPLVITLHCAILQKSRENKKKYANIFWLILFSVSISGIFYLLKFNDIFNRIYGITSVSVIKTYHMQFAEFLKWKVFVLSKFVEFTISDGLSFLLFCPLLLSLYSFYRSKAGNKTQVCLFLLIPFFVYTFILTLEPGSMLRYSMPVLPVMAIITSIGILRFKLRKLFLSIIIPASIIQFFAVSYGFPLLPDKASLSVDPARPEALKLVFFKQNLDINPYLHDRTSHPARYNWKGREVLEAIKKDNPPGKRIKITFLSNFPEIFETISYLTLVNKELVDIISINMVAQEPFYQKRYAPLDELCLDTDYLLISDNSQSEWEEFLSSEANWAEKVKKTKNAFYRNINQFTLLEKIPLPDNTTALIYKNNALSNTTRLKSIEIQNLKVSFDSGRLRIFYNDAEITSGLGLYSSIFSLQHWRDSMEAVWEVSEETSSRLRAKGRWIFTPVNQEWTIDLLPGKIIWQINLSAADNVKIESADYKLMLSGIYKEWAVSTGMRGIFNFKFDANKWVEIWKGDNAQTITVSPSNKENLSLPNITISGGQLPGKFISLVESSDRVFNSNVIGFSKKYGFKSNRLFGQESEHIRIELVVGR